MESQKKEQYIRELNEWIQKNIDAREFKRALAVKFALQGWSYQAIAEALNVSKSFVSKGKRRGLERGIKGLKLNYKGRKSHLSESEKQEVITWLTEQKYWDLSELECYLIEQYDVVFKSPTSYYALLNEAKISWQKSQKKNPRKNPELIQKRNQEIQSILENLSSQINAGEVVLYALDEVHLLEGDLISHLWGDSQERLKISINNEKNRQTYYGALDLLKVNLEIEKYPQGNGKYTVKFLKHLKKINPGKKIIIFWDGASYHKGQEVKDWLTEINQDLPEEEWQIVLYLFAPYAPEENPIEAVWLQLKRLLRKCYRFCKNFKIMKRLFNLFADYKLFTLPNLKNYDAFSCLI